MTNTDLSLDKGTLFQRRLRHFRWAVPLGFFLVATIYQLVIADWVAGIWGHEIHLIIEILFYGTSGPLAAFWVLQLLDKWYREKEQAETSARRSERRLASIAAASADAIISVDPQGIIESWNKGAEMIFGYSDEEMFGKPFIALFRDQVRAGIEYDWLSKIIYKDGWIKGYETNKNRRNGQNIVVELTGTHLVNQQGESRGISFILREITERKRREEEIRQLNETLNFQVAERTQELADKVGELDSANKELQKLDQTRSEFISLVSHQIRAPLTNMQGAVERMAADCDYINDTCGRMHPILEQQIARLDRLVHDVLNVSQIETGEISVNLEPLSIFPVIHQVVDQFQARSSNRVIEVAEKPGMPLALADRARVVEVLTNLLDNADKYSPLTETVSFEVRADQTEVVISVIDSGPGIAPDDFKLIFDKFYRTDSSDSQAAYGYGLGLYVCRLLVEAQGGKIWVENRSGKGSAFSFTLPVWRE